MGGVQRQRDLKARVGQYLRAGGFRAGDQLPAEREFAATLGVGRTALRPILDALAADGVIERRPQAGTFLKVLPAPVGRDAKIALIAPLGGTGELGHETDPLWLHRVVSAFERVTLASGVTLTLYDQSPWVADPASVKHLSLEAARAGADAVVLLHPHSTREKIACALALLHDQGVHPLIISARSYPGLASQVYFDGSWGTYTAMRYLLEAGHQRIGFAGAPAGHEWVQERLQGYRQALEVAEIASHPAWVWLPADGERLAVPEDGARALKGWLKLPSTHRPTALVAANDVVALGVLHAAQQHGVRVPQDLSLLGFDNDPDALRAGLTTLERPTEALGETAARVALERLAAGPDSAAVTHRLRPLLITRATVRPLSVSHADNFSKLKTQLTGAHHGE